MKLDKSNLKNKNVSLNPDQLNNYLDKFGCKESNILYELRKETQELGDISVMQIGKTQGALIQMLCKIGQFSKCIEIGVFTGYSSLCIAKSIPANGMLYALENSTQYNDIANRYWQKGSLSNKINLIIGKALETLDSFLNDNQAGSFDFIFIDADKSSYLDYYEKSLKLVKKGGVILIDNTIWKGKIFNDNDKTKTTMSIKKLNNIIASDVRVDHCLLTIYDGMTLCIKR